MGIPDFRGLGTCCALTTVGVAVVVVGAITMLVTGILGACSILAIPPAGAYVMIGLSIIILAIFTAAMVALVKKAENWRVY